MAKDVCLSAKEGVGDARVARMRAVRLEGVTRGMTPVSNRRGVDDKGNKCVNASEATFLAGLETTNSKGHAGRDTSVLRMKCRGVLAGSLGICYILV